jgi:hypothetical protein
LFNLKNRKLWQKIEIRKTRKKAQDAVQTGDLHLWTLKDKGKLPVKADVQHTNRGWHTNGVQKKQEKLEEKADKVLAVVAAAREGHSKPKKEAGKTKMKADSNLLISYAIKVHSVKDALLFKSLMAKK